MANPSSHTSAPRSSSAVLHIAAGARAAVDKRVIRGEATPEEILHHLFTADADATIVGLMHTLLGAISAASELVDLGASDRSVGFALNLAERLAEVLTSEVDKRDFDASAPAGKEVGG